MTTYHFIGVGGIGMSAIARVLLARHEDVSGSDVAVTPLVEELRREGVRVTIGHDARNVGEAHTVVVSSAIERSNPEYVAAGRKGIPLLHRGEMLARLLRGRRGIAVSGTHGKTTTTAMTHAVLRGGRIDAGLVLGGIDTSLRTNAHDGSSPWFVTEADESDGSFALLEPSIAIVTNIENDHLTSDDELPGLVRAFAEFLGKLPGDGLAIVGIDNPLSESLTSHELRARIVTFGLDPRASVRAERLAFAGLGSRFDVFAGERRVGRMELRVPGAMNVQNALAAVAVGIELGVPFSRIAAALRDFRGVRRRFDVLVSNERATLVDDYAHHPTAVRATIAAARQCHRGTLVVAFQPHRFTRTAYLAREFAQALRGADRVYLAPVYAASEPAIPGVSERSIGESLAAVGGCVSYVGSVEDLEGRLFEELPDGAMVLMLGAGNITEVSARLANRLAALVEARAASVQA
ncbi:MAG TPA: UDP-N-acetylmuramate--L-alanine ligase [Candidatus Dormibacteraeota bacterium]|nr:UDP-N-acetylmuramate--L-alanine ligase [Candidatus Dormibacteraeota bacterium]